MSTTPLLGLREVDEHQEFKYQVLNEAMRVLEAMQHGIVKSVTTTVEPNAPEDGDMYILPADVAGTWVGSKDSIFLRVALGWVEVKPSPKTRYEFYVEDTDSWTYWDGTEWLAGGGFNGGTVTPPVEILTVYKGARIRILSGANPGNTQLYDVQFRETVDTIQDHSGDTPFTDSLRSGFEPVRAFDNSGVADPTAWVSVENDPFPVLLGTVFATPHVIRQLSITAHQAAETPSNRPLTWDYEVSEDTTDGADGTWTVAYSHTEDTFANVGAHTFTVATGTTPPVATTYKAARVRVTATHGANYVVVSELEFRETVGVVQNHAGDTAFSSSVFDGTGTYDPEKAFDNAEFGIWASIQPATLPEYVGTIFSTPHDVVEWGIRQTTVDPAASPLDLIVEVSEDTTDGTDGTWTVLDTRTGISNAPAALYYDPSIPQPIAYRYYRLHVTESVSVDHVNISDFQLLIGGVDVSDGATATSSNHLASFVAQNAIDTDSNTPWVGTPMTSPQWLQVDLGSEMAVEEYLFHSAPTDNTQEPLKWTLEGSTDENMWRILDEQERAAPAVGTLFTQILGVREIGDTDEWRLRMYANGIASPHTHVDEIEFRAVAGVPQSMTSASPYASSQWADATRYGPEKVFDGIVMDATGQEDRYWSSAENEPFPHELGASLATPQEVEEVMIKGVNRGAAASRPEPTELDLIYSTDGGVTWKVQNKYRNVVWSDGEVKLLGT